MTARGGRGIHVRCDHSVPEQVRELFERVRAEEGRLDILVNDIWGGDALTEFGKTFWQHSLEKGLTMLERGLHTHLITSHFAVPLMIERDEGLIIEITDGDSYGYRGNLFYDLVKTSVIRTAFAMSRELRKTNIVSIALTPGFLRSEAMLENFGVTEANWRDAAEKDPNFLESETPFFVGRAVAALAQDPHVRKKNGRVSSSWDLAEEYGFTDIDGRRPHWGRHFEKTYGARPEKCDDAFYDRWENGPMDIAFPDWPD